MSYVLPSRLDRCLTPQTKPSYKIPPNVVKDELFQTHLKDSMIGWLQVKADGADLLTWWEYLVKGGVIQLAQARGKEIKNQRLGQLNILKLRQAYLNQTVSNDEIVYLTELT